MTGTTDLFTQKEVNAALGAEYVILRQWIFGGQEYCSVRRGWDWILLRHDGTGNIEVCSRALSDPKVIDATTVQIAQDAVDGLQKILDADGCLGPKIDAQASAALIERLTSLIQLARRRG